ncbi:serine/threonine protein kinase [Catenulispora sp. MAP12-49]|uniref:protein kinase domain-containing protein n=1 Tax=Catenulispora sp. MAP12-49 TaxID=3156302 RepID=UPI003511D5BA
MAGWTVPGYSGTRVLGVGEAGRIDEAVHDASGDRVTITYLSEKLCSDEVFRERFRREAELLAGLDHPNVVRVRGLAADGSALALVTDAVEGAALRRVLAISGPLSPEAALTVLRASLLGLGAAGDIGVVHRDYQPSDVVVAPDGAVKVGGFGLAVRTGAMMPAAGPPSYMAPELWEGAAPGPVSDIYAATATFYECLTGRVPYTADSVFELQTMHRAAPIPVAGIPAALAPLLALGLAKTPAERPATATAFLAELEAAAVVEFGLEWEERGRRELGALVAALPEEDPTAVAPTDASRSAIAAGDDGAGMNRGTKIGIGAAVIAVIGAVVAAMTLSPGKHSAAAAAPSGEIVSSGSDQAAPTDGGDSPGVAGAAPKPGSSSAGSSSPTSAKATSDASSTSATTATGPGSGSAPTSTATLVGLPIPTLHSWDPPPTSAPAGPPPTSGPGSPTGSSAPPTSPSATVTVSASASMTKSTYSGPCPPTDPPTGAVTFTVGGLPAGNSVPITFHWHVPGTGTGGSGGASGSGEVDARDGTTTTGFTVVDDQHSQKGLSGTVQVTWSAPGTSGGSTTAGSVDITCTPSGGASSGGGASGG